MAKSADLILGKKPATSNTIQAWSKLAWLFRKSILRQRSKEHWDLLHASVLRQVVNTDTIGHQPKLWLPSGLIWNEMSPSVCIYYGTMSVARIGEANIIKQSTRCIRPKQWRPPCFNPLATITLMSTNLSDRNLSNLQLAHSKTFCSVGVSAITVVLDSPGTAGALGGVQSPWCCPRDAWRLDLSWQAGRIKPHKLCFSNK